MEHLLSPLRGEWEWSWMDREYRCGIFGSSEKLESGVVEIVEAERKIAFVAQAVGLAQERFDFISVQRQLALGLALLRLVVYSGTAISFLVFTRPLAKLFTKGLENLKENHLA